MTDLIAKHPIKITVISFLLTMIAISGFSYKIGVSYANIESGLKIIIEDNKNINKILDKHENRITVTETIIDRWELRR